MHCNARKKRKIECNSLKKISLNFEIHTKKYLKNRTQNLQSTHMYAVQETITLCDFKPATVFIRFAE